MLSCCTRPDLPPFTTSLCTLACCSTLTSLSLSNVENNFEQCDFTLLGRLRGLRELTLCFPGPSVENSKLCLSPLAQLTNLQRLVVRGLTPIAPEPAAAAAGGAAALAGATAAAFEEAAAADGDGGSRSMSCAFLSSLTSLVLEGHGFDDCAYELGGESSAAAVLLSWLSVLQHGNRLTELHIVNYFDFGGCFLSDVAFGMLSHLRELRVLMAPHEEPTEYARLDVHTSLALLTSLEVLEVGTHNWCLPRMQHFFHVGRSDRGLLHELRGLKTMAWVYIKDLGRVAPEQPVPLEELCCYIGCGALPEWMTATSCPQLKRLLLDADGFSGAAFQSVAALTQVTFLHLDTAVAYMDGDLAAWPSLGVVGKSLPKLQRLELVNVTREQPAEGARQRQPLVMPNLSAFTQIKQLQLVCEMHPEEDVPEQPSSSDFLQGLSKLTQLEQLQLEGYSTLTPAVVCILVERLPQLQLLEVGLCKHPELVEAADVKDDAAVDWAVLHPGFVEVQELC